MPSSLTWQRMTRRKSVETLLAESGSEDDSGALDRSVGLGKLTMVGVGSTIGTGIFVVLTEAVPKAGPAVILSFLIAGITAALTALCYAEMASRIPVSGASYTYAYATMGEFVAYIIGACLLLEYGICSGAVAVGWGQYLNQFLTEAFGTALPAELSSAPAQGGVVNLPSVVLVLGCCLLLVRGVRESATMNAITVVLKLAVLALFVCVAFTAFSSHNLAPFAPLGMAGIGSAGSMIFFSYIGIDLVATGGEEVRNPKRTVPLAIVFSVIVVTVVYALVALAGVGALPWGEFAGTNGDLAGIMHAVTGAGWPSLVIAIGGVISIFGVTLITIYGQTRVLYSMGRDGMLPARFRSVSRKTRTPVANTWIVCVFVALLAGFVPLSTLANLTSMGTLVAFIVVSIGVIQLRRRDPRPPPFRVPGYPVTPLLSIAACVYLIIGLPTETYLLFALWVGAALIYYFTYGAKHSSLEKAGMPATVREEVG
ncbi:amino acid permease [Sciscionella sediminilitoris]|uniref:amino acid permease n=1 Tax=Sciscionella sediminilitoris TaxID=1445613 RepID=UPI00055B5C36|nr:amino acid permease [Sciscionella sp. SE31]